jgi:hypothetical protein
MDTAANNHIATIIDRPRKQETIEAMTTALSDHFDTVSIMPDVDLTECSFGEPSYVQIYDGEFTSIVSISQTALY